MCVCLHTYKILKRASKGFILSYTLVAKMEYHRLGSYKRWKLVSQTVLELESWRLRYQYDSSDKGCLLSFLLISSE